MNSVVTTETLDMCGSNRLHFGDPRREYEAAKEAAAFFDLTNRSQMELVGRDRQSFLHGFCTNDIKRLQPGGGCEAFVTNVKGRVLGHLFIFACEGSYWLESGPDMAAPLISHFERYIIREDVRLVDRTGEYGELMLTGPESAKHLAAVGGNLDMRAVGDHVTVAWNNVPVSIRRVDLLESPGFLLSTARAHLPSISQTLASSGAVPAGASAFHACRIEAGWPWDGLDLSADLLAPEAGRRAQAISFTKGCYLGQEPIARIDALGHVNRQLCVLGLETAHAAKPGTSILDDQRQVIGSSTSSAAIPGEDKTVAMALVRTSHSRPGTAVFVNDGNSESAGVVCRRV